MVNNKIQKMKNLLFVALVVLSTISCQTNFEKKVDKPKKLPVDNKEVVVKNENQKIDYTEKYGLLFVMPETWKVEFENNKSVNLKGEIMTLETDYSDKIDHSRIRFVLHPGKRGTQIYNSKIKNLSQGGKFINIDGKQAIEKIEILHYDGKGHPLNPPTTRHKISILTQQGEVDIIFDATNKDAEQKINQFITQLKIKR